MSTQATLRHGRTRAAWCSGACLLVMLLAGILVFSDLSFPRSTSAEPARTISFDPCGATTLSSATLAARGPTVVKPGTVITGYRVGDHLERVATNGGVGQFVLTANQTSTLIVDSVAWINDDRVMPSVISDQYVAKKTDLGSSIQEVVHLTTENKCASGYRVTPRIRVLWPAKLALKVKSPHPSAATSAVVRIDVRVTKVARPEGLIIVKFCKKTKTVALGKANHGRLTVEFRHPSAGRHKLNVKFIDTTGKANSPKAKLLTIHVTR